MSHDRHGPSADDIRADIERTRERLGDTVEALGAHLNPSLLKARVKDSVHEATIGRAKNMARNVKVKAEESGRGLVETVRENPIPVALIAGGIGWLLFSKRRRHDVRIDESDDGTELGTETASTIAVSDSVLIGKRHVDEPPDYSRDMPSPGTAPHVVADKVKSAGERVASGARAAGARVAATTSQVAHTVADRARDGGRRIEENYDSNPMVLGAVAAAVGLAVGMSLPISDKEAELMGGKRDQLVDRARETLSETKDKVRSAAERAVPEVRDTLKEVARQEGLAG